MRAGHAVFATMLMSLVACGTAVPPSAAQTAPQPPLSGALAADVSNGLRACTAALAQGAPLSNLEREGFWKSPIFERWSKGSFAAPVSVTFSSRFACQTSYRASAEGLGPALDLATQVLERAGYARQTPATRSENRQATFTNPQGDISARASFSTQSGSGRITLTLKN